MVKFYSLLMRNLWRNATGYITLPVLLVTILLMSCAEKRNNEQNTVTVSILPLKYIVESIVGDDFTVQVLVPPGSSPETYEPTPRQLVDIDNSKLLFTTGLLDFEKALFDKISIADNAEIVELYKGIDLIEGDCDHHSEHAHNHGIDPHIWLSLDCLETICHSVAGTFMRAYPDSVKYAQNYEALSSKIDNAKRIVSEMLSLSNIKSFYIYHPALTYYARDYGLEQISLEHEGKEPSVASMKDIIADNRDAHPIILYQREFSAKVVETLSQDLDAEVVQIDPLAENVPDNIIHITSILTGNKL
jgi:zinc transport system substrate-binding protein